MSIVTNINDLCEKKWLSTKEASIYLSVSVSRLLNLTSNGTIPYYKLSKSNRYLREELDELILSQPKGKRR